MKSAVKFLVKGVFSTIRKLYQITGTTGSTMRLLVLLLNVVSISTGGNFCHICFGISRQQHGVKMGGKHQVLFPNNLRTVII